MDDLLADMFDLDETQEGTPAAPTGGPAMPRPHHGHAGLVNHGCTCYLNSFLQVLYHTPELYNMIISLSEEDCGVSSGVSPEYADALLQLTGMGIESSLAIPTLLKVGPDVAAAVEYAFSGEVSCDPDASLPTQQSVEHPLLWELRNLFANLAAEDVAACDPMPLLRSFGWTDAEIRQQHDVFELFHVLNYAFEALLGPENAWNQLLRGEARDVTACSACDRQSVSTVPLYELMLEPAPTLTEALRNKTLPELLHDYRCPECGAVNTTTKSFQIDSYPTIATVVLNRFTYDLRKGTRVRNNSRVDFDLQFAFGAETELRDYEFMAAISHLGTAYSGHYISLVRADDLYFNCDDSVVRNLIDPDDIDGALRDLRKGDAYVLFYRRTDRPPVERASVPAQLLTKIAEHNRALDAERDILFVRIVKNPHNLRAYDTIQLSKAGPVSQLLDLLPQTRRIFKNRTWTDIEFPANPQCLGDLELYSHSSLCGAPEEAYLLPEATRTDEIPSEFQGPDALYPLRFQLMHPIGDEGQQFTCFEFSNVDFSWTPAELLDNMRAKIESLPVDICLRSFDMWGDLAHFLEPNVTLYDQGIDIGTELAIDFQPFPHDLAKLGEAELLGTLFDFSIQWPYEIPIYAYSPDSGDLHECVVHPDDITEPVELGLHSEPPLLTLSHCAPVAPESKDISFVLRRMMTVSRRVKNSDAFRDRLVFQIKYNSLGMASFVGPNTTLRARPKNGQEVVASMAIECPIAGNLKPIFVFEPLGLDLQLKALVLLPSSAKADDMRQAVSLLVHGELLVWSEKWRQLSEHQGSKVPVAPFVTAMPRDDALYEDFVRPRRAFTRKEVSQGRKVARERPEVPLVIKF